jgi:hypothetical protein
MNSGAQVYSEKRNEEKKDFQNVKPLKLIQRKPQLLPTSRALGDFEYQFFSFFSNGCYCIHFSEAIGDLSS